MKNHDDDFQPAGDTASYRDDDLERSAAAEALVSEERAFDYRSRWDTIQADFIDEPRRSVEEADRMVSEVIEEVVGTFQEQRSALEAQWAGEGVSTEDLRMALRRYRSFFERLLSTR